MAATKNDIYDTLVALSSKVLSLEENVSDQIFTIKSAVTQTGTALENKTNSWGNSILGQANDTFVTVNNIKSDTKFISGRMDSLEAVLKDVSATMLLLVQRINAVESKVNGMTSAVTVPPSPAPAVHIKPIFDPNNPPSLTYHMKGLVQQGKLIDAIKAYREHTAEVCAFMCKLAEAKVVVDAYLHEGAGSAGEDGGIILSTAEKDVLYGFATVTNNPITNAPTYSLTPSKKEDKLGAILLYRQRTGEGLKEAKEAIEAFMYSRARVDV
jgi:ribosomal protein L7/L12